MKRLVLIACVVLLACCGSGHSTPTPVAYYAGNWVGNWSSEEWNGVAVQKNGTVTLAITSAGAVTGTVTMQGQTTPALTITSGQLAAGGTGTFTITDNTTNVQYNGTAVVPFSVDSNHLNLSGSIETTNTSGALWDFIDMGLSR